MNVFVGEFKEMYIIYNLDYVFHSITATVD